MGPLGTTLPTFETPRVNAQSRSRRISVVADPCFFGNRQLISALTHATRMGAGLYIGARNCGHACTSRQGSDTTTSPLPAGIFTVSVAESHASVTVASSS